MNKTKILTSLTSLGLVALATPIIATSCSYKYPDVTNAVISTNDETQIVMHYDAKREIQFTCSYYAEDGNQVLGDAT